MGGMLGPWSASEADSSEEAPAARRGLGHAAALAATIKAKDPPRTERMIFFDPFFRLGESRRRRPAGVVPDSRRDPMGGPRR